MNLLKKIIVEVSDTLGSLSNHIIPVWICLLGLFHLAPSTVGKHYLSQYISTNNIVFGVCAISLTIPMIYISLRQIAEGFSIEDKEKEDKKWKHT